ncbi:MAG TPA: LpqB family beta-propeller domain-containing protein [Candidatus Didemnitutus sp.]|nr:LpqB family beta-propeller domain-containing protein [Candidatus Didemnitutus sp.]
MNPRPWLALCLRASALVGVMLPAVLSAELVSDSSGQLYFSQQGSLMRIDDVRHQLQTVLRDISARRVLRNSQGDLMVESMQYDAKADLWRPGLWRYSPSRQATEPNARAAVDDFTYSDVADSAGRLYFWQGDRAHNLSRLLVRQTNGDLFLLAGNLWGAVDGIRSEAQLGQVGSMAIGPDETVYFTDDGAIRRATRGGTVETIARGGLLASEAGAAATGNPLVAIAVDDRGVIFVAHRTRRQILRIAVETGEVTVIATSAPTWTPASLAWSRGALYVLETGPRGSRAVQIDARGQIVPLEAPLDEPVRSRPIWLSAISADRPALLACQD